MDTGNVVDVEVLSKFCKMCNIHEDDDDTPPKNAWKIDYKSKYKANFEVSAPAMEPERARRIFERSVEENKLCYTEYLNQQKGRHMPVGNFKLFSKS